MSTGPMHRLGSRTVAIAERRGSLVRMLIALFVARIVVTAFLGVLFAGYRSVRLTLGDSPPKRPA